jgi:hypothetical protein
MKYLRLDGKKLKIKWSEDVDMNTVKIQKILHNPTFLIRHLNRFLPYQCPLYGGYHSETKTEISDRKVKL